MDSLSGTMWRVIEARAFDEAGNRLLETFGRVLARQVVVGDTPGLSNVCEGRVNPSSVRLRQCRAHLFQEVPCSKRSLVTCHSRPWCSNLSASSSLYA
jgi:hypothetical protein